MKPQDWIDAMWAYVCKAWSDGSDDGQYYYERRKGFDSYVMEKVYFPKSISLYDDGAIIHKDSDGDVQISLCAYRALMEAALPANQGEFAEWQEMVRVWEKACSELNELFDAEGTIEHLANEHDVEFKGMYNTYNDTDSPLSQVIQYGTFKMWGREWIVAQMHQGLDVRAGYSPYVVLPHDRRDAQFPYFFLRLSVDLGDGNYEDYEHPFSGYEPFVLDYIVHENDTYSITVNGREASLYTGINI